MKGGWSKEGTLTLLNNAGVNKLPFPLIIIGENYLKSGVREEFLPKVGKKPAEVRTITGCLICMNYWGSNSSLDRLILSQVYQCPWFYLTKLSCPW